MGVSQQSTVKAEWERRVKSYAESGKTQTAWCAENGLNNKTFGTWYRRLGYAKSRPRRSGVENRFIPVRVLGSEKKRGMTVKVGLARIEVEEGFDATLLRAVVSALGAETC